MSISAVNLSKMAPAVSFSGNKKNRRILSNGDRYGIKFSKDLPKSKLKMFFFRLKRNFDYFCKNIK